MTDDELSDEPIAEWIRGLQQGDELAARQIWRLFIQKLCDSIRQQIRPGTRRVYDEDDVAQSAFRSLFLGAADGRFPDLSDRDSLWRLLLVIAARKLARRHRFDWQQRRDTRRTIEESVFRTSAGSGFAALEQFASREPTAEFTAEFTETSILLFEGLNDPQLQEIARLKIEGLTDSEIAERLNCSRQAVQRKMERIRRQWKGMLESEEYGDDDRAGSDQTGI